MATYTTSNGRDYEFSFERQLDGSIRPYISKQPDYGERDADPQATHRSKDNDGRLYVDWTKKLYTMKDAKEVAAEWAKRTDVYIDTGTWKPYRKTNQQQPTPHETTNQPHTETGGKSDEQRATGEANTGANAPAHDAASVSRDL